MKKTGMILMMAFMCLSFSCKKQEQLQESIASDSPLKKDLKSLKGEAETSYDTGGTIGCIINFTNPSSSGFHDNDAYDNCMDGALGGTNVLGNIKVSTGPLHYPAPECLPCIVPSKDKLDLMAYYWTLLGVTEPQTEQEYSIIRDKLAIYNTVITTVFTNSNGELEIPAERFTRRNQLLSYSGTLPAGIVDYVDFVYGKYFAVETKHAANLFYAVWEPDGTIHPNTYGVKIIGNVVGL